MNTFMGAMLLGLVVAAGAIPAVLPPARRPSRGGSPHPARDPLDVDAYDLDGFDTPKATVDRIHANGGKGICYISVGSWESWRPDKGRFPKRILGRGYYGWPGEKWLDVRQLDALAPIMEARMDACKEKGFDAIEPDTTWTATRTGRASGSRTPSNSATTRSSQRPREGPRDRHEERPGPGQRPVDLYYFAITEDCFDRNWCGEMGPFIDGGRAVLAVEYTDTGARLSRF